MTETAKELKIKFLVERRFGCLARFTKTSGAQVGGSKPGLFGTLNLSAYSFSHDAETVNLAHAYRASLEELDEAAVNRIFGLSPYWLLGDYKTPEDLLAGPSDFKIFNDEFFASANVKHWSMLPYWALSHQLSDGHR